MAMGQDDEVGALEPVLEAFRMLGIAGPERVDQHAVAGDVQMKRRMAEPGQLHGRIPPAACSLATLATVPAHRHGGLGRRGAAARRSY